MKNEQEFNGDILPPTPIRVETAISRYPVHRLAKSGEIAIDIREKNEGGETSIKWEVTHSPGPLAYKIDTLVVNRRIEDATRPIPKIIRLGSLREICRELGYTEGENTKTISEALRQNAFAGITARIRYRLNDGSEKFLKANFTRYSVVFLGEELPNGVKADAVYIILNDVYMQILNGAMTRPLDYDYLKILPPAAQRFYELLSYQMYAAIKNDRDRAKLVYSELCKYAPLTRQTDWNIVRPQLARIHAPHKKSGYIGKIDFQDSADSDGRPDWVLLYQPGPKARADYRAFTKRGGPVMLEVEAFSENPLPILMATEPSTVETSLIGHGVTASIAGELVEQYGEEAVALQVEHLEWLIEKKPGKVTEPGAWLRMAITNSITPPKTFVAKAEREQRAEVKRQKDADAAAVRRRQRDQKQAEESERRAVNAYYDRLTPAQLAQLEADAIAQASEETQQFLKNPAMRRSWKTTTLSLAREHIARLIQSGDVPAEPV